MRRFNFDEWRTFVDHEAVSLMSSANEIEISPDEDGKFACSNSYGCTHDDSTWYPPQCDFPGNECAVLLQFLPEHDLMNRETIIDNNLKLVIKYMGSALSSEGLNNFRTFYEGNHRVIFQMRRIDLQSHDNFGWTQIPLPPNDPINVDQPIFRLRPSWLLQSTFHLLAFHDSQKVWFGARDINVVTNRIIDAVQSGLVDSPDLRMQLVCDRMKEFDMLLIMIAQKIIGTEMLTVSNCDGFTDKILEFVVDKADQELLFGPAEDIAYYNHLGIGDGFEAIYTRMHCILEHEDDRDEDLYTFGYILSGFALICVLVSAFCTFIWRKEKIIRASSVKMLGVIYVGAALNLSYILFPRYDRLSHCYLRKYVLQVGIALMFAALEAKTRRLHVIQKSIKMLKRVFLF